jgi:hypothetical protein
VLNLRQKQILEFVGSLFGLLKGMIKNPREVVISTSCGRDDRRIVWKLKSFEARVQLTCEDGMEEKTYWWTYSVLGERESISSPPNIIFGSILSVYDSLGPLVDGLAEKVPGMYDKFLILKKANASKPE